MYVASSWLSSSHWDPMSYGVIRRTHPLAIVTPMLLVNILLGYSHVLATLDTLETVPIDQVRIFSVLDIL